jgi:polysaccharide biosynthesis transport protein
MTSFGVRLNSFRNYRARRKIGSAVVASRATSRFLRVHLLWILVVTGAVVAGAGAISWSRSPVYKSQVDVLVQPRLYTQTSAPQVPDMGTEKAVVSSGVVLDNASSALGIDVDQLHSGLSVGVPLQTNILQISYASTDPAEAQRRAQAIADAYVAYWVAQLPVLAEDGKTTVDAAKTAVITPAVRASTPSSPNHGVDIGIAILLGLAIGVGTALLRDRFNDGLRGAGDLEAHSQAPVLTLIPAVRVKNVPASKLVVRNSPNSLATEAYQDLRTRVLRAAMRRGAKTLLVTSPASREHSNVAANLAVALAQSNHRVVLVCADLRRPRGHELFGLDNGIGLTDVIGGHADLDEVVRETEVPGLKLLAAGRADGDQGGFLHGPALRLVIGRLRGTADFVVIDAPPILAGADTGSLAELADMVLVAADAKRTTRSEVDAAMVEIEHVRPKVIGAVLDNVGRRTRLPVAQQLSAASRTTRLPSPAQPDQMATSGPLEPRADSR